MKYPLLPYSRLVWEMTRWLPMVYRFPMTYVWRGGAKEKQRIQRAIQTAIENHPVFSMRVDAKGMHYADYVLEPWNGPYMKLKFAESGDDLFINTQFSRILGDGKSGQILIEDVKCAYEGLPMESDDYWGYVARYEKLKKEPHYTHSQTWLIREFADESVPVRPTIDRKWLTILLPPKAGLYTDDMTSLREQINHLIDDCHLTKEGVFSLSAALAIAEYCGSDEAALTWAYEGRETPEEQHIFGSLHRDVPFKIKAKGRMDEWRKEELIKEARNQIRQGIAHSDYPYTLTKPFSGRWNYAVNVLRVESPEEILCKASFPLEIVSIPKQKYAYALLDVEIHEKTDELRLVYRYSATHYKESSIHKFAALVRKYVEWLIND